MRRGLISTEDQGLVFPNLHEDPSLLLALSPITILSQLGRCSVSWPAVAVSSEIISSPRSS